MLNCFSPLEVMGYRTSTSPLNDAPSPSHGPFCSVHRPPWSAETTGRSPACWPTPRARSSLETPTLDGSRGALLFLLCSVLFTEVLFRCVESFPMQRSPRPLSWFPDWSRRFDWRTGARLENLGWHGIYLPVFCLIGQDQDVLVVGFYSRGAELAAFNLTTGKDYGVQLSSAAEFITWTGANGICIVSTNGDVSTWSHEDLPGEPLHLTSRPISLQHACLSATRVTDDVVAMTMDAHNDVELWSPSQQKRIACLTGQTERPVDVTAIDGGALIGAACGDRPVRLWSASTYQLLASLELGFKPCAIVSLTGQIYGVLDERGRVMFRTGLSPRVEYVLNARATSTNIRAGESGFVTASVRGHFLCLVNGSSVGVWRPRTRAAEIEAVRAVDEVKTQLAKEQEQATAAAAANLVTAAAARAAAAAAQRANTRRRNCVIA